MDASLLWYPERVHLGPKHKFSTYYMAKVSEVLRNTTKHYFGSNGVERMLCNYGAPKPNSAVRPETQVLHLFTSKRLWKCSETLSNIIWGLME
jgi:hypothetical protein